MSEKELIDIKRINDKQLLDVMHEREALIKAYDEIRAEFRGRRWLMDGRGPYPYNDERYKQEVRYIMDAFESINARLWSQIKSKSFEYRNLIEKPLKDRINELENGIQNKSDYLIIHYPTMIDEHDSIETDEVIIRLNNKTKEYVDAFVEGIKTDKPVGYLVRVEQIN